MTALLFPNLVRTQKVLKGRKDESFKRREGALRRALERAFPNPNEPVDEAILQDAFRKEGIDGKTDDWMRTMGVVALEIHMERAVAFSAPSGIARMLAATDNTGVDEEARLPFECVWLDGEFEHDERSYYGILGWHVKDEEREGRQKVMLAAAYRQGEEEGVVVVDDALSERKNTESMGFEAAERELRFLAVVAQNWLFLLDAHGVETTERKVARRDADIHRRNTGETPPSSIVTLRILDERLAQSVARFEHGRVHFSHRFRVRGHWKTFTAARYKQARGKRVWVLPYYKGEGLLIEKPYKMLEESGQDQA